MPLPLTKEPVVPNALYAPSIVLHTNISGGQIATSAQITLRGAKVDEQGNWSAADSQTKTVYIPNIFALESDIVQYSQEIGLLFNQFVTMIGNINSIRKVI
jgi:hypothetical protein